MTNHAPVPAPLKKRRAAKSITGLIAAGAGAALALVAFTLTQPGSASTNPNDEVDQGDVTVSALTLDDVQQGAEPVDGGDPDPFDFTFTNAADEDAGITLNDIRRGPDYTPDQQAFYDSLLVSLQAEGADAPFYTGPLSGLDTATPLYVGDVAADDTLTVDVKASTTVQTQSADPLDIAFEIDYEVGPAGGTPAGESQCAPLEGTPLLDPCQQFEDALGGLAGGDAPDEGGEGGEGGEGESQCAPLADTPLFDPCQQFEDALGGLAGGGEDTPDEGDGETDPDSQCAPLEGTPVYDGCLQFEEALGGLTGGGDAPEEGDGGTDPGSQCAPLEGTPVYDGCLQFEEALGGLAGGGDETPDDGEGPFPATGTPLDALFDVLNELAGAFPAP